MSPSDGGHHETFVFPLGTTTDSFLSRTPGVVMRSIHRSTPQEDSGALRQWLSMYPSGALAQKLPRRLETITALKGHALRNDIGVEGGENKVVYLGRYEELHFLGERDKETSNPTAAAIRKRLTETTHLDFRSMSIEVLKDLRTVVVGSESQ